MAWRNQYDCVLHDLLHLIYSARIWIVVLFTLYLLWLFPCSSWHFVWKLVKTLLLFFSVGPRNDYSDWDRLLMGKFYSYFSENQGNKTNLVCWKKSNLHLSATAWERFLPEFGIKFLIDSLQYLCFCVRMFMWCTLNGLSGSVKFRLSSDVCLYILKSMEYCTVLINLTGQETMATA